MSRGYVLLLLTMLRMRGAGLVFSQDTSTVKGDGSIRPFQPRAVALALRHYGRPLRPRFMPSSSQREHSVDTCCTNRSCHSGTHQDKTLERDTVAFPLTPSRPLGFLLVQYALPSLQLKPCIEL